MSNAKRRPRLRVLMSAYACEPGAGSEQGVGWYIARAVAEYADVCVITRSNNRDSIERELHQHPVAHLSFVYFDLPAWTRSWKRRGRGVQLYYYLWQLGIGPLASELQRYQQFDVVHHVTFVKYWAPSLLGRLPAPFIWGPVGGGESVPAVLLKELGRSARAFEWLRTTARSLAEKDSLVRQTARQSSIAIATTLETAERLRALGATDVRVMSQVGMCDRDLPQVPVASKRSSNVLRVVSMGRLVNWKGFHLGLRAFADSAPQDAEYWIIGDGPERTRLADECRRLGIDDRVRFFGELSRSEALGYLGKCHILIHPSLHDSGGFVCLEAMALGLPVICLDTGGPAILVDNLSGVKVLCTSTASVNSDLATALRKLTLDIEAREAMGTNAMRRARDIFTWHQKARALYQMYEDVTERHMSGH